MPEIIIICGGVGAEVATSCRVASEAGEMLKCQGLYVSYLYCDEQCWKISSDPFSISRRRGAFFGERGPTMVEENFCRALDRGTCCSSIVIPMIFGRCGEDGAILRLMEERAIQYFGPSCGAARKLYDKSEAKIHFAAAGASVPKYRIARVGQNIDWRAIVDELISDRLIVKPVSGGSSHGLSIVSSQECLIRGLRKAWLYNEIALIEAYVPSRLEFSVAVLSAPKSEQFVSASARVAYRGLAFTAKLKATPDRWTVEPLLAIQNGICREAEDIALNVCRNIGLNGFNRFDVRVDKMSGKPFFLECDTIAPISPKSIGAQAFQLRGIDFPTVFASQFVRAPFVPKLSERQVDLGLSGLL